MGVDEDNDDFSSEDEGVEVDLEETDDEDSPQNSRLLQQLAASLAQELKLAQRQNVISSRTTIYEDRDLQKEIQCMEISQESSLKNRQDTQDTKYNDFCKDSSLKKCLETKETPPPYSCPPYEFRPFGKSYCESSKRESSKKRCPYSRVRTDGTEARTKDKLSNQKSNLASWNAGWDSCASETLRYLVEDEGLPPHHPTVVAMKNHLDLQREQAFLRYS